MKEKDKRRDARGESRERAKCQRETLGKYFYDLSKLTFTALVLGLQCSCLENPRDGGA